MEISFADEKERSAVRTLWQYCFGDSESYMNAFFSYVYKTENTIVARDGDVVIGSLQMFPHMLHFKHQSLRAMYIGGVSVLPSYRGQGVATLLMEFAESYMRKHNVSVSFLVPFSFGFYQKMGYRCISFLSEYSGPITALKPYIQTDNTLYPISAPPVAAYSAFASQFSLYAQREAHFFTNEIFRLCSDAYCYALPDDAGYILYSLSDGVFHALECAYRDEKTLRQILGFIYAHRAEAETFRIRASADGSLRKLLCEKTIAETRYPHAMAKVLSGSDITDSMHNYINMLGWF